MDNCEGDQLAILATYESSSLQESNYRDQEDNTSFMVITCPRAFILPHQNVLNTDIGISFLCYKNEILSCII